MLVNKEKLNAILKDFYTLSKVRVAVFDEWQREIAAYPSSICNYCRERRKTDDFNALCLTSDAIAFKTAATTQMQYTYKCHAGLYESVCPIISNGAVLGFLMVGQFINEKDGCVEDKQLYGSEVKSLSSESVQAIASIMSVCAEYLCFSNTVSVRRIGLAEKAERYVCEHLGDNVTVKEISEYLGISRTSTHTLFKKHFGKSVVEYVNYQKIDLAKRMIDQHASTHEIIKRINILDPNYFYRVFKKHTGMSVSEYKRLKN